jgi:hypothetical protein
MTTKNKYSIKGTLRTARGRAVDGPWKPTVVEAIEAFKKMLANKGLGTDDVRETFVAERCLEAEAPACDVRGNYYRTVEMPLALV